MKWVRFVRIINWKTKQINFWASAFICKWLVSVGYIIHLICFFFPEFLFEFRFQPQARKCIILHIFPSQWSKQERSYIYIMALNIHIYFFFWQFYFYFILGLFFSLYRCCSESKIVRFFVSYVPRIQWKSSLIENDLIRWMYRINNGMRNSTEKEGQKEQQ